MLARLPELPVTGLFKPMTRIRWVLLRARDHRAEHLLFRESHVLTALTGRLVRVRHSF
jgi:hypothetical protein